MASGEVERKVLQLVYGVLRGDVEPTPSWLMRPGIAECGDRWSLISRLYHESPVWFCPKRCPLVSGDVWTAS
jgi:hypothetical protein